MATVKRHVALYCRISKAPNGRVDRIADQEAWGREYAARTWPGEPVVVYSDNNLSAAKEGVARPGYDRLREAIAAGQVAQLWAKEQSRLERLPESSWFAFAAFAASNGLPQIHTRAEGVIDVDGLLSGIKAVVNGHEIRQLRGRVKDRLTKIAEAGRPPSSTCFGYRHGTVDGVKTYVVVEHEAAAIRFAADKVLAGWSLARVTAELQRQGVVGPHRVKLRDENGDVITDADGVPVTRPGKISYGSVRNWLTRPTVAAHRVHQGVDLGPGSGKWEPILDEQTWQACRRKLAGPRPVRTTADETYVVNPARLTAARRYLLTGLVYCGVCRAPMSGTLKMLPSGKKPYFNCHPSRGGRACTAIMLEGTEKYVLDRLWAELDKPEFLDRLSDDDDGQRDKLTAALEDVEAQRRELARMWGRRELSMAEWQAARAGLDEQEAALNAQVDALPPPLVNVDIATARAAWPSMELDERREFIRLFVGRVTVSRATVRGRGFDSNRVSIDWAR